MKFSLKGRLANFDLPASKAMNPLFEAIVNSIHAIEEKFLGEANNGEIQVTVIRNDDQLQLEPNDRTLHPITGFIIQDNGVGFDDNNFNSFETSDSIYKLKLGGKGVGRFTWLKAFKEIKIESVFGLVDKTKRSFEFTDTDTDGIKNLEANPVDNNTQTYSKVMLFGLLSKYQKQCPKRLEVIASKIIEHCLSYFVLGTCPNIIIKESTGESLNLMELYIRDIDAKAEVESFELGGNSFQIKHIKIFSSESLPHRIHWCAHQREVIAKPIEKIPNLSRRLLQDDREFSYSAYLSGSYLDKNVNSERTNFLGFGVDEANLFSGEVTWKGILEEVRTKIKDFLASYLEPIREEKMERVKKYISNFAPEYRHLWCNSQEEIDAAIDPETTSDTQIDLELYRIRQSMVLKNKCEAKKLLTEKIEDIKDTDEFLSRYEKVMKAVSDDGRSDLARYIVQRKVILDLLERSLQLQQTGKYCYEEVIHNMIMPKGYTSDDIEADAHNLWLIDEKLAYHYYLASDIPFNQVEPIAIYSDEEADMLILNNPSLFVEGTYPFGSITIVEFKRPNRSGYSKVDNPFDQIYGYIKRIRSGNVYDKYGQHLSVNPNTPFYCYLICDIKPAVETYLENNDFIKTPEGDGYYKYHNTFSAYIEVIPYKKLVSDAKKRNRVLFEHLHL